MAKDLAAFMMLSLVAALLRDKAQMSREIILSHGDDVGQFQKHENSPFKVVRL